MDYNFEINNRAFKAIKERSKRATKVEKTHFDYSNLKENDIINFTSFYGEKLECVIGDVNWYDSIEKLLIMEGNRYTLSSTNDFNE